MISLIILGAVFLLIAVRKIGNLRLQIWQIMLLGAASNVIIIQNAEQKFGETLTFLEFVKIGIPLTVANTAIYWLFFMVIG